MHKIQFGVPSCRKVTLDLPPCGPAKSEVWLILVCFLLFSDIMLLKWSDRIWRKPVILQEGEWREGIKQKSMRVFHQSYVKYFHQKPCLPTLARNLCYINNPTFVPIMTECMGKSGLRSRSFEGNKILICNFSSYYCNFSS
jgi:hypothetical protein